MNPIIAKRILTIFLKTNHLPYIRLTAEAVDFSDLARGEAVFVTIHGWQPSPRWQEVADFAKESGFMVEAA